MTHEPPPPPPSRVVHRSQTINRTLPTTFRESEIKRIKTVCSQYSQYRFTVRLKWVKSTVSVESRVFDLNLWGAVSIFACFLIVRFVLPPWISLYFFDICIHVIISCKNNDSVSWERKETHSFRGIVVKKAKIHSIFSRFEFKQLS